MKVIGNEHTTTTDWAPQDRVGDHATLLENVPGKRLIATGLAAAAVFGLAGCGEKTGSGSNETHTGTTQSQTSTTPETTPSTVPEKYGSPALKAYAEKLTPEKLAKMSPAEMTVAATLTKDIAPDAAGLGEGFAIFEQSRLTAGCSQDELTDLAYGKGMDAAAFASTQIQRYDAPLLSAVGKGSGGELRTSVLDTCFRQRNKAGDKFTYNFAVNYIPGSATLTNTTLTYETKMTDNYDIKLRDGTKAREPMNKHLVNTIEGLKLDKDGAWNYQTWKTDELPQ